MRRLAKGKDLLQGRGVVVLRREAQHAAGAREVGIRVVALVAEVDDGVAAAAVVSIEEGAHVRERVAVKRLDETGRWQPQRDQLRQHVGEVQIEAVALEALLGARDQLAKPAQRRARRAREGEGTAHHGREGGRPAAQHGRDCEWRSFGRGEVGRPAALGR
jgi:hypothetical protein